MTPKSLRTALAATLACLALPAFPALAGASSWTVDDDGVQCPNAAFSSIQAAVDQVAPNDTIVVCAGVYRERSTPTSGTYSFSQTGSRNGLTIQKPLTIKGAGADKVFIEPDPSLGSSLAGTVPNLRDGGGNVITIARQSLGSSDDNENTVDISGITVRSPYAYVEAGIAYFNTSGTVAASTVGPLRRAAGDETNRPYGWGVIQTNSLIGTGPGTGTVRRQVTVKDSLVTGYQAGGILFDSARGLDGSTESTVRGGITQYGYVTGTKVVGGGNAAGIGQTGIRYHAGTRGAITDSTIQDNAYFVNAAVGPPAVSAVNSYGVLLTDAVTETDAESAPAPGLRVRGNAFINNRYGLYNADVTGATVRVGAPVAAGSNWWGCIAGPLTGTSNTSSGCQGISGNDALVAPGVATASVTTDPFVTTVPATLAVPAATADAAPTASFSEPVGTPEVSLGETIAPVVAATDDFGVASVTLAADGAPVATLTRGPYEFGWSPSSADAGHTVALTATVTDSSGQVAIATVSVKVAALPMVVPAPAPPAVLVPPVNTALPVIVGEPLVGATVTCLPGNWTAIPGAYGYQWVRAGTAIAGATAPAYRVVEADTASELSCSVTASNADGSTPAASASRLVTRPKSEAGGTVTRAIGPVVAALVKRAPVSLKRGKVAIGTVTCARALATRCTVTITGTVKVGKRRFTLTTVRRSITDAGGLTIVVPAAARKALKPGRHATVSLKVAAIDDTGFASSYKSSLTITGKR